MGRIKTGLIKRTSKQLINKTPDSFSSDFEQNKKALGKTMPGKRMKNMIAGYIARLKKQKQTQELNNNKEEND